MELFTIQCQQLPKFCPFVSELKDSLFRSRERKFQGTKVPRSESSLELLLPGAKVQGNESSRERKFHGTFAPGSECSSIRLQSYPGESSIAWWRNILPSPPSLGGETSSYPKFLSKRPQHSVIVNCRKSVSEIYGGLTKRAGTPSLGPVSHQVDGLGAITMSDAGMP